MAEKAYYLHYKENCNSWGRMMMLFELYWPGLKKGFLICALYPFLTYIFIVWVKKYTGESFKWFVETPMMIILYCAPLMLTKRDYRDISDQLPITAVEKLGFLLLTFWIAVPLTMAISLKISEIIGSAFFQTRIPIDFLVLKRNGLDLGLKITNMVASYIISTSFLTVPLYYVVTSKNRAKALALSFLGLFAFFIVMTVILALASLVREDWNVTEPSYYLWSTVAIIILYEITAIIYLVKLYKYLRNRGF